MRSSAKALVRRCVGHCVALASLAGLADCGGSSPGGSTGVHFGACTESVAASCGASTVMECFPDGYPDSTYACGSYDVHYIQYVDTYGISFYDPTSGALIAVVDGNGPFEGCAGGPADFALPSCPNAQRTWRTCPDAGAD